MSNEIRLNKYLSEAGICSRREADRLIEAGKVTVDGTIADLGTRVGDSSVVPAMESRYICIRKR